MIRRHMATSVCGLLRRTDRELDGILTINGKPASGTLARQALTDALADGKKLIPCCDEGACPDFDYTGGGLPGPCQRARRGGGMSASIEKNGTGVNWRDLYRRVSRGTATETDADPVEQIGLLPQAIRIRNGLADHQDAMLIALQVELTGAGRGVAA